MGAPRPPTQGAGGVSRRALDIPSFIVMEVMERAQELEGRGEHLIHLEVGEPDFPRPACIQEAMARLVKDGMTGYTHSLGIRPLREAIAEHYQAKYGVEVSTINPGDRRDLAGHVDGLRRTPGVGRRGHPLRPALRLLSEISSEFCGGVPACVDVLEEERLPVPARGREGADRPRGDQSHPHQLPGQPHRDAALGGDGWPPCRRLWSAGSSSSDEIYHGLVYEGREHSILEFTDRAVVFNGFSKAFAMTGWRLGYVIVPPELVRPLQKMHQNFFISANAFVQAAGIAALAGGAGRTRSACARATTSGGGSWFPASRAGLRHRRGAERGLLRLRQRQAIQRRLLRLRLRDPGARQGLRGPGGGIRHRTGEGYIALLVRQLDGEHRPGDRPVAGVPGAADR